MIEIVNDVITIPNWSKHQTLDAYEKRKARDRERVAKKRAEQRALAEMSPDSRRTVGGQSPDVAPLEEEREEEEEKEKEEERERDKRVNFQLIAEMYNETCVSFPRIRSLSESRKKAIKARLNTYTVEDFKLLFEKAEASDFLKGKNKRNWSATFDWLIQDSNMAKVLDGNYDTKEGDKHGPSSRDIGESGSGWGNVGIDL